MDQLKEYRKRANQFINEQEETFSKERVDKIVDEALTAFWTKVKSLAPEIETDIIYTKNIQVFKDFKEAADLAIRTWINANTDGDPVM